MCRKAIILSAGQGKRLQPLTESRPKCLLQIEGRPIVEWQIRSLAACDIEDAVVVTGFGADMVENFLDGLRFPGMTIRTIRNPYYHMADNIVSCWMAREEMRDEFVLLNGDTLFESAILDKVLCETCAPITITIDRKDDYDADDMKVIVGGERLHAVSKSLDSDLVDGESIGMLKFDPAGGSLFVSRMADVLREPGGSGQWYLKIIDRLAKEGSVGVVSIEGLSWGEVDYPHDLRRARDMLRAQRASTPAAETYVPMPMIEGTLATA